MREIDNFLQNSTSASEFFNFVKTRIQQCDSKNVRVTKSNYFIEKFCNAIRFFHSIKNNSSFNISVWELFCVDEFLNINLKTDIVKSIEYNPYTDSEIYLELLGMVLQNPHGYMSQLRNSRHEIMKWIDSKLSSYILDDATISTKVYWILTGLTEMPKCIRCGKNIQFKNIKNLNASKYETCSQRCSTLFHMDRINKTKLTLYGNIWNIEKCKKTYIEKYGCRNPLQNPDVQMKRVKAKYEYDGKIFDSKPELAYYIWLTDTGRRFVYHDFLKYFEYNFKGKINRYFPDFYLIDEHQYVEIKGSQFFRPDGSMFLPYKGKHMSDEKYIEMCNKYEAKHQCMIANGVKIITDKNFEHIQAMRHVANKYGKKNWHEMFRVSRIVNKKSIQ